MFPINSIIIQSKPHYHRVKTTNSVSVSQKACIAWFFMFFKLLLSKLKQFRYFFALIPKTHVYHGFSVVFKMLPFLNKNSTIHGYITLF